MLRVRGLRAGVEGKEILRGNLLETLRAMRTTIPPLVRRILDDAWEACRGSDCLVYHPKALGGRDIAMAQGIPAFVGLYLPMLVPTRRFPNPILPARSLGGSANRLSYSLTRLMTLPYEGAGYASFSNDGRRMVLKGQQAHRDVWVARIDW